MPVVANLLANQQDRAPWLFDYGAHTFVDLEDFENSADWATTRLPQLRGWRTRCRWILGSCFLLPFVGLALLIQGEPALALLCNLLFMLGFVVYLNRLGKTPRGLVHIPPYTPLNSRVERLATVLSVQYALKDESAELPVEGLREKLDPDSSAQLVRDSIKFAHPDVTVELLDDLREEVANGLYNSTGIRITNS